MSACPCVWYRSVVMIWFLRKKKLKSRNEMDVHEWQEVNVMVGWSWELDGNCRVTAQGDQILPNSSFFPFSSSFPSLNFWHDEMTLVKKEGLVHKPLNRRFPFEKLDNYYLRNTPFSNAGHRWCSCRIKDLEDSRYSSFSKKGHRRCGMQKESAV